MRRLRLVENEGEKKFPASELEMILDYGEAECASLGGWEIG